MGFYDELQTTANRLLNQFGQPATVKIRTGDTYDPATQTNTPVYTDIPAYCFVTNYAGLVTEDGTLVNVADRKLVVGGIGTTPQAGDSVLVNGVTYRAVNVQPVQGQGTDVVYIIQGAAV